MSSPFDFVKSVGERRDDPILSGELIIDDYNPYIVNRALSFRKDSVEAVQVVNENHQISKKGQYIILRELIYKRKPRKGEFWVKQKQDKNLEAVMAATGLGREKAADLLSFMTPDDLNRLQQSQEPTRAVKEKKK